MSSMFFMGQISGDPWVNLDGRLNAPSGTPQFPTLLNGYPTASPPNARVRFPNSGTQPQWMVAGVDYPVGPSSTAMLQDPCNADGTLKSFFTALGISAGPYVSGDAIHFDNISNVVIDSYNFGLRGLQLWFGANGACNDITISNCEVASASGAPCAPIRCDPNCSNFTIKNCFVDGGGVNNFDTDGQCIRWRGSGSLVIQYNELTNAVGHILEFTPSVASITVDLRFNVLKDFGMATGSHGNSWYNTSSNTITNSLFDFNTCIQGPGILGPDPPLGLFSDTGFYTNTSMSNNTAVQLGSGGSPPGTGWDFIFGGVGENGTPSSYSGCSAQNNYFDPRNLTGGGFPWKTTFIGTTVVSGNTDMTTGSVVAP